MRWRAIANGQAGRPGCSARVGERLRASARVHDLVVASAAGDSQRAASDRTFDGFVVIGGDGTIAAVLAAMDTARQCIAVFPCGHGNCLARAIGVDDERVALAAFATGYIAPIDLMHVRLRRANGDTSDLLAASTLATGYVADVVQFGRRRLGGLGRLAYAAASLVKGTRRLEVRVSLDNEPSSWQRLTGVVVNNTPHLANFRAFPSARLTDGRLDVMLLAAGHARQVLHNLAVTVGSSAFGPQRVAQAERAVVELVEPGAVMIDGEFRSDIVRIEAACVPSGLRIVQPAPGGQHP